MQLQTTQLTALTENTVRSPGYIRMFSKGIIRASYRSCHLPTAGYSAIYWKSHLPSQGFPRIIREELHLFFLTKLEIFLCAIRIISTLHIQVVKDFISNTSQQMTHHFFRSLINYVKNKDCQEIRDLGQDSGEEISVPSCEQAYCGESTRLLPYMSVVGDYECAVRIKESLIVTRENI